MRACELEAAPEEEASSSHWPILLGKSHTRTTLADFCVDQKKKTIIATGTFALDVQ